MSFTELAVEEMLYNQGVGVVVRTIVCHHAHLASCLHINIFVVLRSPVAHNSSAASSVHCIRSSMNLYVWGLAIFAAFGGFMFGYDIG